MHRGLVQLHAADVVERLLRRLVRNLEADLSVNKFKVVATNKMPAVGLARSLTPYNEFGATASIRHGVAANAEAPSSLTFSLEYTWDCREADDH